MKAKECRGWETRAVRADQTSDTADAIMLQQISEITKGAEDARASISERNAYRPEAVEGEETEDQFRRRVRASILDLQSGLLERETEVSAIAFPLNYGILYCIVLWSQRMISSSLLTMHVGPFAAFGSSVW